MKRRTIKRLVQWLLLAALAFLLYLLLGATLPNLHHKDVTPEFAERFDAGSVYGDAAGTERAAYVGDNVTALEYRLAMIESAQDEVVLAAYEFSADEPGTEVLSALQAAAERGVRVRVLVDGVSARLSLKGAPFFQALAGTENVQIRILGDIDGMPDGLEKQKSALHAAVERTRGNTGLKLCIALNYGGRQEIVRAARILAQQAAEGLIAPEEIDMPRFESQLYTAGLPEVDFLIRTSGEIRLSNFLLYQLAYAEFYQTDILWPDFDRHTYDEALLAYTKRNRRFGGV